MAQKEVQESETASLSDRLYQTAQETNDDGTVNVSIYNVEEHDDKIAVEYRTPTGMEKREVMPFPNKDSDEFKFVRVANNAFGGLENAQEINSLHDDGDWCARADPDDDWTIVTEPARTLRWEKRIETVKKAGFAGSMLAWLTTLFGVPLYGILTLYGIVPTAPFTVEAMVAVWVVVSIGLFITAGAASEWVEEDD